MSYFSTEPLTIEEMNSIDRVLNHALAEIHKPGTARIDALGRIEDSIWCLTRLVRDIRAVHRKTHDPA